MTNQEFRIAYSEIMEQYQYIEEYLESIYSSLTNDARFYFEGFRDVEKTNLRRLVTEIKKSENGCGKRVLSDELVKQVENICGKRNFWAHESFTKIIFNVKNGDVQDESDAEKLRNDLKAATELRNTLFELQFKLLQEKQKHEPQIPDDFWGFKVVGVRRL